MDEVAQDLGLIILHNFLSESWEDLSHIMNTFKKFFETKLNHDASSLIRDIEETLVRSYVCTFDSLAQQEII